MFHRIISGVAVVALTAGAGLVATTGGAEAKSPRPTLTAPASVAAGQTFAITVKPHHKGTVTLQRKAAKGHWRTVADQKSRRTAGKLTFPRAEHKSGRVAYRAKVAGQYSKVDRVTVLTSTGTGPGDTTTPPPTGDQPTLYLQVTTSSGDDIFIGDTYTVGIEAVQPDGSPITGLAVTVQRQDPGSSTWTTSGTYTTDDTGEASFPDSSSTRGIVNYRATGGKLSGETQVVVWQDVTMPSSPGNGLAVTHAAGCTTGASGSSSEVDLTMASTTSPACQVQVGNSITATWTFGGNGCAPVQYSDLWFSGPASSEATMAVAIDDVDFSPDPSVLNNGDHSNKLDVDGDLMQQLVISMTASAGTGGTFVGHIVGAHAICF